ncbi:MAG: ABC transporter permease [Gammaproteobacteria bacterium HGW-Gammaproteobacteria-11]|nr:MAG: ABC transporter permease [Gammaproteobacteria bacterium HGW-Gammaproteobacteria-11]
MISRFLWVLHSLISHWRRHPLQAGCLLIGLWLATALWTGVQALNSQARDSYDRAAAVFGSGQNALLVSPTGQPFDQALFVQLRRQGWAVSPIVQGSLNLSIAGTERRVQLTGFDPLSLPGDSPLTGQNTDADALRDFLVAPGRTWLAAETMAELGVQPGDRLDLTDGQTLPALQVIEGLPPGQLFVDIGQAQRLLGTDQLTQLLVAAEPKGVERVLPTDFPLVHELREEADLGRLTDSFHLNLSALGLLAFAVGLFIVHAAFGLALEQRRGLLQSLRASGVSLPMLAAVLLLELLLLALLGGSLGVLSGFAVAAALIGDLAASLRGLYGAQLGAQLNLDAGWWLAGLGMALCGTLLAGGSRVLTALRLPLLAWARPQAWREAQNRSLIRLALLGTGLLIGALLLVRLGDGLLAGFALLAALLLGVAWLLPLSLSLLLRGAGRLAKGPVAQWFWADSQQQLSGLGMALMALMLALAANVGVGSMTEGFRLTFSGWLDQRLAADVYVRPASNQQAREIVNWLDARPEVLDQLPSWQVQTRVGGWPSELSGIVDHPLYADTWPLLDARADAWPQLAAGEGVLLSEQLAYRLNLQVNDALTLDSPQGPWTTRVLGSYADYGNPRGQILLSANLLAQLWPEQPLSSLGVLTQAGSAASLAQALQSQFDLASNRVIDQASLKRYSRQVFEQTFAATAALNTLTLGVAAVALLTSLLSLSDSRLNQLAPLWAMGLRPRQLAWLSLLQMLVLATLTALLAIPLGLLLAWCLVDVVNVQAFGWRLPWHWFPMQWLTLVLMALLAVLLASLVPLWRLARTGPQALLKGFTNEV